MNTHLEQHHHVLETALGHHVSRETWDKLVHYADLLVKWQASINLVSASTLPVLWERHILDSAQIIPFLPEKDEPLKIMDMGSGGGFPALVLAILTSHDIHCVESDSRKSAFLRTVAREVNVPVSVHVSRVENLPFMACDVITARALAPLQKLLELSGKQHHADLKCIFLKGRNAAREKQDLKGFDQLLITSHVSMTSDDSSIFTVENFN